MGKHDEERNVKIIKLIRIIFIIIMLISLFFISFWFVSVFKNKKIKENLKNAVVIEHYEDEGKLENIKVDFNSLKEINNDIKAWIKVPGTEIEYWVVKAKDNNYKYRI